VTLTDVIDDTNYESIKDTYQNPDQPKLDQSCYNLAVKNMNVWQLWAFHTQINIAIRARQYECDHT